MSPHNDKPLIYLIAGEASGDFLGASLMAAIKKKANAMVCFSGIGGPQMEAEGLKSLFPYSELSIVGFVEILPHLPKLIKRLNQTRDDIINKKPDIVITIDSPGFNFPLVHKIRKQLGSSIKIMHYVAPTVWAYKPERAEKIAKIYDHLLLLLPFEKPYFDQVALPCTFIGHPVIHKKLEKADGPNFREKQGILPNSKLLCMLPGSRKGEIKRHLPVFKQTAELLAKRHADLTTVIILNKQLIPLTESMLHDWPGRVIVIESGDEKNAVLSASNAALSKSGTITLEVARAEVPMVVTYRVNPISAWKLRRVIQVPYVTLINIILNKMVIPELLQEDCRADKLADALTELLEDNDAAAAQIETVKSALEQMGLGTTTSPSEKAAEVVTQLISSTE